MTIENDVVVQRIADLTAACAAVAAFQHNDRQGTAEAIGAITPGRSGEALLALAVVLVDQVARVTGRPWDEVMDGMLTALMSPAEREVASLEVRFAQPSQEADVE